MLPELRQSYATALPELSVPWSADPVATPRLVAVDAEAAAQAGIDPGELRTAAGLAWATGQVDGTTAQAYAGHQFGHPNPQMGDGRALLLGDVVGADGRVRDLHLKGSGRTPFARGGDGKAALGPMLRELVVSEAMAALGVPTTRAVAVIATGEEVLRPPQPAHPGAPVPMTIEPRPGAILLRSAASHLRVGTFQYAAWHHGPDAVRDLAEFAIDRHWPQARDDASGSPLLGLLRCVTRAQADLVARWMLVGFVHGVMNTDNMTISGETIDYGPCAFLDEYRADAVFSSIDTGGRYAYGRQPAMALWNLSRFAEALLPAIAEGQGIEPDAAIEAATGVLEEFELVYLEAWTRGMAAKLGIAWSKGAGDEVRALAEDALARMQADQVDFTGFFRRLTDAPGEVTGLFRDRDGIDGWMARLSDLRERAAGTGEAQAGDDAPTPSADSRHTEAIGGMARVNPVYIPRNEHVEHALQAATRGDMGPLDRLREALRRPFERRAGFEDLETAPDAGAFITYCGT